MTLRNYRNLMHLSLLAAAGLLYCGRISFYLRLLPLLRPDADSVSIPLFREGLVLAAAALSLGIVHYAILGRLARHGVRRVEGHFPDFLRTTSGIIIGLLPFLLFTALYGASVRGIWNQVGFDALDLLALPPCALYLALFSNLCLSMDSWREELPEPG